MLRNSHRRERPSTCSANVSGERRLEVICYENHLGLRVGNRRFQMTRRGFKSTDFARWIRRRMRNHPRPIEAVVLDVSPRQMADIVLYLETDAPGVGPYSYLFRNCAGITCTALRAGGIPSPPRYLAWSPYLAFRWLTRRAEAHQRHRYLPESGGSNGGP